jgi:hypothetical protein
MLIFCKQQLKKSGMAFWQTTPHLNEIKTKTERHAAAQQAEKKQ